MENYSKAPESVMKLSFKHFSCNLVIVEIDPAAKTLKKIQDSGDFYISGMN